MSNIDNKLLDALRQLGVDVLDTVPTTLSSYWYIVCGPFDTFVDGREAATQEDALNVAYGPLQNWYVHGYIDKVSVRPASRNEYIEWLKRGVL